MTAPEGIPARQAAWRVLNAVTFQRRALDEAFAGEGAFAGLPPRDRGFVRLLVATVLKRARQIDAFLETLLAEPISNLRPPQLLNILRLGVAQSAFLETPPHAAVDTAVDLAAAEGITHHKPLVNAVLRRAVREGMPRLSPREAGKLNTPGWLWDQWMRDYGVETALDIAAANLGEAPVDFTVKSDPAAWAAKLEADLLPTGSLRRAFAGFVPDLPGFADGAWWVQGASAALPALLFGDLRGKTAVDLCAAPGGKTAQLAAMGAKVTALDRSANRMEKLRDNMRRLKLDVETVIADGSEWRPAEPVDAVLLDAPCTATGTIRHQPDVLHLKEPKDQEKMAALQRRLMANAVRMLKPGGTLIYCTCSLQKAEGEVQTDWLLAQPLPATFTPIRPGEIPGADMMLTERGELRCLPQHWNERGGMDGFYIARFTA